MLGGLKEATTTPITGPRLPSATKTSNPVAQAREAFGGTKRSSATARAMQIASCTASQTNSPYTCVSSASAERPRLLQASAHLHCAAESASLCLPYFFRSRKKRLHWLSLVPENPGGRSFLPRSGKQRFSLSPSSS